MALAQRPRYGVEGLSYALLTESTDIVGGTPAYGTIYSLPGVAKIGVNPNGKPATDYLDDGAALVAETTGAIDVDLELGDIMPADEARLFGHAYTNGQIARASSDQSPFVALLFKVLRSGQDSGNPVYDYFVIYKVKFAKPDASAATKKDTPAFQHVTFKGMGSYRFADKLWSMKLRTDDPAVPATTITNFFTAVPAPSADLSAFTLASGVGSITNKTITLTFSKATAAAVLDPSDYNVSIVVVSTGAVLAGTNTYTPGVPGTSTTLVVGNPNIAGVAYSVVVGADLHDTNGIGCVKKGLLITPV